MVEKAVVYRNRYLPLSEMVRNILREEGLAAIVKASDPFGAFASGPHLATYQPTPCSLYEVLVPEEQRDRAREIVDGIAGDEC